MTGHQLRWPVPPSGCSRAGALRYLWGGFDPAAEDFGYAPGLGDAASRGVGCFGVEDFADGADALFIQVGLEAEEHFSRFGFFVWVELEPGIDVRADEPGPDGSLVVGGIAGA